MVSDESQGAAEVVITGPGGQRESTRTIRRGGAPWSYDAALASPAPGRYAVQLVRDGKTIACRNVDVAAHGGRSTPAGAPSTGIWTASRAWDRATENFYAAWIESLFDAPVS